mgnify:FL=1
MSNLEERKKSMSFGSMHTVSSDSSPSEPSNHHLIADSEEIFPNPIISKRGYINVFDQPDHRNRWAKCYVVSCPLLMLYPPCGELSYPDDMTTVGSKFNNNKN